MNNEIKEINIPENVLVALGDLTNGALNYYKATETVKVRHNTILDYITNLQTIEHQYSAILSENAELENKITNLQEENKELNRMCEIYSKSLYNADLTKANARIERLNNIINELEKTFLEKIEAIKAIKDILGEEAKIVNPHIEVLETEYKYFLDKLKELKEGK